ncbi:AraC family transcriptional regulator [bacterium]|nr:AraC family transcriptional regulator [bacterium]
MKSVPLIHTSWLKPFAIYFGDREVDLSPYYAKAGLENSQVTSGDAWITKHQLYDFLNSLAEGEKSPEIGFLVGEKITPDSLGAISEAMAKATTLGEVIRTFCKLINQHVEENRCWLEEGEKSELWFMNVKDATFPADRAIADHAGLMSMINLVRLAGGKEWYPKKVKLLSQQTDAPDRIPGLKDSSIEFNHTASGFTFPASWLLLPVHIDSPALASPTAISGLLSKKSSIEERLTHLIESILGVGGIAPTVDLLAVICQRSPRTLHRELKASQIAFQPLLDKVRLERARRLLKFPAKSVKEVAFDLGYSGSNNFIRFFKRKHGCTPTQYQQDMLENS